MKHLMALMAFLLVLMLLVSGVMAVGNEKQAEQMAQRTQQVSDLKAELRAAEQQHRTLTGELTGLRRRNAALRAEKTAISRRLSETLRLAGGLVQDPADLRPAFAATGAASGASTAAWLPDLSGVPVSKALLPLQGEALLRLTALENVMHRLIGRKTGGADSWDALITERDTAVTERDAAVSERDTAITERDTAIAERDAAITGRDNAVTERDAAIAERDTAITERDAAVTERNTAIAERDAAIIERDAAVIERDTAIAERDTAVSERDAAVIERNTAVAHRNAILIQHAAAAFIENAAVSIKERLPLLPRPAAAPAPGDDLFTPAASGRSPVLSSINSADPQAALPAVLRQVSAAAEGCLYRLIKVLQDQLSRIGSRLLEFHHP